MQLIIDLAKSWDIEIEYRALPDHAAESATSAPAYVQSGANWGGHTVRTIRI